MPERDLLLSCFSVLLLPSSFYVHVHIRQTVGIEGGRLGLFRLVCSQLGLGKGESTERDFPGEKS